MPPLDWLILLMWVGVALGFHWSNKASRERERLDRLKEAEAEIEREAIREAERKTEQERRNIENAKLGKVHDWLSEAGVYSLDNFSFYPCRGETSAWDLNILQDWKDKTAEELIEIIASAKRAEAEEILRQLDRVGVPGTEKGTGD